MNIGIIGTGAIGTFLLKKINNEQVIPGAYITAVLDERMESTQKLETISIKYNVKIYRTLESFLTSPTSLIVECANIEVVRKYAREIVRHKDLFLISVGALVDVNLRADFRKITKQRKRKVYLPAGAIGGLDIIRAANVLGGLDSVKLISRKPAHALISNNLTRATTIFEGSAQEAIVKFPKNANIAIIISLSGIGVEKTKVKIIADPTIRQNIHQLEAYGDFGKLSLELENNPSPTNPKTSYLTALSILASLKNLDDTVVIG